MEELQRSVFRGIAGKPGAIAMEMFRNHGQNGFQVDLETILKDNLRQTFVDDMLIVHIIVELPDHLFPLIFVFQLLRDICKNAEQKLFAVVQMNRHLRNAESNGPASRQFISMRDRLGEFPAHGHDILFLDHLKEFGRFQNFSVGFPQDIAFGKAGFLEKRLVPHQGTEVVIRVLQLNSFRNIVENRLKDNAGLDLPLFDLLVFRHIGGDSDHQTLSAGPPEYGPVRKHVMQLAVAPGNALDSSGGRTFFQSFPVVFPEYFRLGGREIILVGFPEEPVRSPPEELAETPVDEKQAEIIVHILDENRTREIIQHGVQQGIGFQIFLLAEGNLGNILNDSKESGTAFSAALLAVLEGNHTHLQAMRRKGSRVPESDVQLIGLARFEVAPMLLEELHVFRMDDFLEG